MTAFTDDLNAKIAARYSRIEVLRHEIEQKTMTIQGLQNEITEFQALLWKVKKNDGK